MSFDDYIQDAQHDPLKDQHELEDLRKKVDSQYRVIRELNQQVEHLGQMLKKQALIKSEILKSENVSQSWKNKVDMFNVTVNRGSYVA